MKVLLRILSILCFLSMTFFIFAFIATRSYISFAAISLLLGIILEIVRDKCFTEHKNDRSRSYKTVQ